MRKFSIQLSLVLAALNLSVIFKVKCIPISRITILEPFIQQNYNFVE